MTENWVSLSRNRLGPNPDDHPDEEGWDAWEYWGMDEPPLTPDEIAEMNAEDEADRRADAGAYD